MNQQISLDSQQTSVLMSFVNAINSSTECEIRLGNFFNKKDKRFDDKRPEKDFVSNVEIDFFYRLKQILNNSGIEKKITYTKEIQYKNAENRKGKIRQIFYTDSTFQQTQSSKPIFMLKNQHRNYDYYNYEFRASLSTEKILDRIDGVDLSKPTFFRFKNRTSYNFQYGVLDMTIVYQGFTEEEALLKNNIQYEVEFEIKKKDYPSVLNFISYILTIRQDNFFLIDDSERKELINEYRTLTSVPYFVGVQPETLQKDQLSQLFKELYSVTDKADGERCFMYINSRGLIYFIDSNINNILKTNMQSTTHKNCILDGELIKKRDNNYLVHMSFYAFDILFFDGNDLRENLNFLLKQRLEKVHDIISSLNNNDLYSIHMKKFIYRNVFIGSDIIMKNIKNQSYENDGLIFTPMNEPYPKRRKWTKLLKWKPAELNTIDFYTVKENNKWILYVQNKPIEPQQPYQRKNLAEKRLELVKFDVDQLCGTSGTTHITFETTFDDSLIDPTTGEPFQSNTVIEFKWNGDKFVPLRTRWDKTSNPNKQGNFSTVACSIWNNIHNPITATQLFQMTNTTTEHVSDKNFFFERMTDFHTKINGYLINKYINNLTTSSCDKEVSVLELNTFNIVKSDKCNTFTFCNSIKQTNLHYKNFKLDLLSNSACNKINNSIKRVCDAVFCLKFNSFFQSQEILDNIFKTIDYNIQKNGILVLSFIDSAQINKLNSNEDENKSFISSIYNNEIMYFIDNKNTSSTPFNKSIKLFINGISNENEPIEYTVDYNFLIEYMKNKGYKCIETELYSNMYKTYESKSQTTMKLLNYEQDISGLYRICVFQKVDSNISTIINKKEELNIISKNYLIEHKNIQFHKIKTTYDIFNILNCLKYNIFKYKFNNTDITCMNDIKNCIETIHCQISYYERNMVHNSEEGEKYIYFYNTIFEEEVETEEGQQIVSTEQFYVVLFNNGIIQTKESIETINTLFDEISTSKEMSTEMSKEMSTEMSKEMSTEMSKQQKIKDELKNLGAKITVVTLKEFLKELGLKTSGKKDELLQRLHENLV